jgi:DNA-directed RNA polymerase subunit K/omega
VAQVDTKRKKPTSTALEEIAQAKVGYRVREAEEPSKT